MWRAPITLLVGFGFLLAIQAAPTSDSEIVKLVAYASADDALVAQRLADQKKVIAIDISDQYITATYGKNSPSNITTWLVLESPFDKTETTFVYGKDCDQNKCKAPPVKSVYAEQGTNKGSWKAGTLQGQAFQDSVTLGEANFMAVFGSVNTKTTYNYTDSDGQFSLGIGTQSQFTMVKTLFGLGPERYVTIYRDSKTTAGQMLVGRNGHDKCNNAKMYPIVGDGHWWIGDAKIKVDDKAADKQKVEFSINEPNIKIPIDQYTALIKDQKPDANNLVGDVTKLKSIELTLGNDIYVLKPEDFTTKNKDNKYQLNIGSTTLADPANIVLGIPFLQKNCYVLNGKDDDITKWQIGVGEHKNSATMMSASAVLMVALVQLLRF